MENILDNIAEILIVIGSLLLIPSILLLMVDKENKHSSIILNLISISLLIAIITFFIVMFRDWFIN